MSLLYRVEDRIVEGILENHCVGYGQRAFVSLKELSSGAVNTNIFAIPTFQ